MQQANPLRSQNHPKDREQTTGILWSETKETAEL